MSGLIRKDDAVFLITKYGGMVSERMRTRHLYMKVSVLDTYNRKIKEYMDSIQEIDAVPVVRCKECWKRGLDNCPMEFYFDCHPAEDDCYCKFGEYGTAEEINEKDKD